MPSMLLRGGLCLLWLSLMAHPAWSQEKAVTTLLKIITVKDEIVIGLNTAELDHLGGRDAGVVARALVSKGEMTAWQYAVRRGPQGDLQQAPLQKVGLLAHSSLRVEPYTTPYPIVAHD